MLNIIGLPIGIACTLLIFLWVSDEMKINKFHANDANLYQILEHVDQDKKLITRKTTAGPMSKALKEEFPEIQAAVTASTNFNNDHILSIDDHIVTGKGYLRMLNFSRYFHMN